MQLTEQILWGVSSGTAVYFLKRIVDKVDKSATRGDISKLSKRVVALETLVSNLSRDVSRNIAEVKTELKWVHSLVDQKHSSNGRSTSQD